MRSLTIFVLSYVSLTLASPYRRNHDWFFDKDFKDNSKHDNDESREFFRSSTKKHNEATTASAAYYTTEDTSIEPFEPDYETTEASVEPDYETTTEASVEPDYEVTTSSSSSHSTLTVDPDYYTTDITTEESDNDSSEERFLTTKATTVDAKSRVKAYYQQRKKQALTCKQNEHIKTQLDEFGNPDCQLCTCDGQGMLVCNSISCSDNGLDTKKQHETMIHNSGNINLILREHATGCKPGTTVEAGQCSCYCVLPSVMSCPKNCFTNEDEESKNTEDDEAKIEITTKYEDTSSDSQEWKHTVYDEAKIKITTEYNEATVEIITTDDEVNVERITKTYEAKIDNTAENDDVDEIKTKIDEFKFDKTTENTVVSSVEVVGVIEDKFTRERKKESGKSSRGPTKKYMHKHRL